MDDKGVGEAAPDQEGWAVVLSSAWQTHHATRGR